MRAVTLRREQTARGLLILVDPAHPLRPGPDPELTVPDSRYPAVLLERRAAGLLAACIRAAGGERDIVPVSGWRSRAEQQSIWDDTWAREGEAFTRRYVALPGCSEHQTGLAVDLGKRSGDIDFIRPDFPDSGACGAFRRLAADYGFIQRYRREKEAVTGIGAEPWHFRYVGVPHATAMAAEDLCLEEYVEYLKNFPFDGQHLLVNCASGQYEIWYCAGSAAYLPDQGEYTVSGNNTDGLIVTCKVA